MGCPMGDVALGVSVAEPTSMQHLPRRTCAVARRAELLARLEAMFRRHEALLDGAEASLKDPEILPDEPLDANDAHELEQIVRELGEIELVAS